MNLLESLIYGLLSGLAELLPISSQGHQVLMNLMFGSSGSTGLLDFFVHLGCLAAVVAGCFPYLLRLYREQLLAQRRRTRRRSTESNSTYDIRLLKTAAVPMLIGLVLCVMVGRTGFHLLLLGILFIINGIILFIQEHIAHGNKAARKMTGLDGILIGASGAFSVLPGISRVGTMLCTAVARGADRNRAVNWVLILSIPALLLLMILDLVSMLTSGLGVASFMDVLGCIFSAVTAFAGAYGAIILLRFMTQKTGYALFAYYSWGAGLLSLILYLTA